MSDIPTPVVEPLDELTTEQLLITFRRLPRLPGGVNEREMKQLESYLVEARRRDAANVELEAEFIRLLDQREVMQAQIDTLRVHLAAQRDQTAFWRRADEVTTQLVEQKNVELAALRAQLAERDEWEPVPDGLHQLSPNFSIEIKGDLLSTITHKHNRPKSGYEVMVRLSPNIRLWRRRNGSER